MATDRTHEYYRSDALAELSAETDLPHGTIAVVLDAITKLGIRPQDWQRERSASNLSDDPRLHLLRRLCKGAKCHARIFWAHTGRTMTPVDYEPVEVAQGTIRLVWPQEADPFIVVFPMADTVADQTMRETLYPGERWYKPHWQSCPDAPGFRINKPKAGQT